LPANEPLQREEALLLLRPEPPDRDLGT
jgi:hypothetical protein